MATPASAGSGHAPLASETAGGGAPPRWDPEGQPGSAGAPAFKDWSALLQRRLEGPLRSLFQRLTDLRLQALSSPPVDGAGDVLPLNLCSAVPHHALRQSLPGPGRSPLPGNAGRAPGRSPSSLAPGNPGATCRACLARHWQATLKAGAAGHQFRGVCGITHFWTTIRVEGQHLLGLAFEIRANPRRSTTCREPQAGPRSSGSGGLFKVPAGGEAEGGDRPGGQFDRRALARAVFLARWIAEDLRQTAALVLAERRIQELEKALHVQSLKAQGPGAETARKPTADGRPSGPRRPSARLVDRMLEHLQTHFTQPITLKQLAATLNHNPTYLSDLFSRTTGHSFRKTLNGLRLARSVALLADPTRTVTEVAGAVGFTNTHEFRWAFRHWTGLSPRQWREAATSPSVPRSGAAKPA